MIGHMLETIAIKTRIKLLCITFFCLTICGCTTKRDKLYSFTSAVPTDMSVFVRKYNARHPFKYPFTSFWKIEKNYQLMEGRPEEYYVEFGQRLHFGYETILQLQKQLSNVKTEEGSTEPDEEDLIYVAKNNTEGTLYYFYVSGYIKVVGNDERMILYVNDDNYHKSVVSLQEELRTAIWD